MDEKTEIKEAQSCENVKELKTITSLVSGHLRACSSSYHATVKSR